MMAENRQERTATELASQRINATNPGVLEIQNAANGGVSDIHEAAARAQQQIDEGEEPEQAVSAALGAAEQAAGQPNGGGQAEPLTEQAMETAENVQATMMEAIGPVMGQAEEAADGAQQAMSEAVETVSEQADEAGGMVAKAGEAAARTGRQLVEAARGFAMEVSEALFGGQEQDDERDKI